MSVENPRVLIGPGESELPAGLSGNIKREPLVIESFAMRAHAEPDGSGYLLIFHGGLNQKFLFGDTVRRELIAELGGKVE